MPLLREVPSSAALADHTRTVTRRDVDRRAVAALDRRLTQLEADHETLQRQLAAVERAVRWLPFEKQRTQARRRLRALGHDQQLDAFEGLHDVIDGTAAA